ncbi:MAG: PhzF family phenazine biosynthesis protein [Leptolyngbyaceae cyanobacterium bins.349]|nr:PhzF family phenazine biosynthesis protein [Leptolyngbyaceae cyanobacterium bins.349]
MQSLNFYMVDVFAERQYAGNPLAVFTNAGALSTEQMQQIAREINFSETTFILSPQPQNGGYGVRIFTPARELPFAGHPTLGTAFVLQQAMIQQPVAQITLNLPVGPIPVTIAYQDDQPTVLWMRQNPPVFGQVLSPTAIAPVLNLHPDDLDHRFPIQEVSTGVPFIIVPLKSLAALQRIRVNTERLFALVETLQAKEIFVFCPETRHPNHQFSARMFAPLMGIAEDPATGSANGCFAAYLVEHEYLGSPVIEVEVEQGYEMGRPSLLLLKANQASGTISLSVGGAVVMVAKGEFV